MEMPRYHEIMLPILKVLADGKERPMREVVEHAAEVMSLPGELLKETYPTSGAYIFADRAYWARTYLLKAGRIEAVRRGVIKITPLGIEQIQKTPEGVAAKDLADSEEFREFAYSGRQPGTDELATESGTGPVGDATPQQRIEDAFGEIKARLKEELLTQIVACSPDFFERLVVDLLVAMGYGGNVKDAGRAVGATGDGGIDGIIKEDKLGLDLIYLQAKRWQEGNSVGRPEVQKFVGALGGVRARKGVFITTSAFSSGAIEYAKGLEVKVILIDGSRLTDLMIEHQLGLSVTDVYRLMRLDSDYFTE